MLNRVILIGRATKDPELRYTPSGVAVSTHTIAVDRPFKNANDEREADFLQVVAWRGAGEFLANNLRKGKLHAVEGRIQTRHYDNDEGKRVYITEVVADNVRIIEWPDNGSGGSGNQGRPAAGENNNQRDPFEDDGRPVDISDDDLPF